MSEGLQLIATILIYGLVNSVILILTALGFSLTFGLSRVANFAHGGIYLLSGYVTWMLLKRVGLPYPAAILLTILATGLLGALIYRFLLMRVRGIELSEVIATFAAGVAILELFRWLGFVTYEFNLPPFVQGQVRILGVFVDYQRLLIIAVGLALAVLLYLFSHHTRTGLALRGMAQDEYTALTLGIESDWAAMLSVALGSSLTAVAAVSILPLGIISINVGYDVLLVALAVAVVGGLESTMGLVISGVILGFSMVITSNYLGPHWMMVVYLVAIVLVLAIRPSGILGQFKEIEERV
ncbi:MAG TPA: branched-chain amino acid ABC transporter permease [Xanthomonadales bacterium]|nr:branched-chain amino acid ABC transporter permease [Xanthomonadales bacterium]